MRSTGLFNFFPKMPQEKQLLVDKITVGRRNNSIILISVLIAICSLAFQNCSSLQALMVIATPAAQAQSKKDNPLYEMMNYSEQQIKDTRQKLEKRSDLFGEERLENLKVGPENRIKQEEKESEEIAELEGSAPKMKKRQIATDSQSTAPAYDEDLSIEDITNQKTANEGK